MLDRSIFAARQTICGECLVLRLQGELDLAQLTALEQALGTALDSTRTLVVIDLTGITFCGVSGVEALIRAFVEARSRGLRVCIAGAPRTFLRVAWIGWPDVRLELHADAAAALATMEP